LYRTCISCARLRQAHFADIAEKLLSKYKHVYLARITPEHNSKREIERIKAAIKRQLSESDAVWSVEQGTEKHLLHINLLSPAAKLKPFKGAEYWQGEIVRNLRQIAAYMIKPDQIPTKEAYQGKQFGSFQNMKQLFTDKQQLATIQAAAAETITLSSYVTNPIYEARQKVIAEMRANTRSHLDIANDHLPKLRSYVASLKGTVK
jgi:hypothetical protein